MPIIKSISGIRGTIGETQGENLTTADIVGFSAAFGVFIKENNEETTVVIGRDARISGSRIKGIVINSLTKLGIDVIDLGLATTPTVEMAVIMEKAQGGIIVTASHNPKEWNALKMLNEKGEFITAQNGEKILAIAEDNDFDFLEEEKWGKVSEKTTYLNRHIDKILELELVKEESIRMANLKIVVDGINSVGGVAVPELLKKLGVKHIIEINCTPDGEFAHNPEPLEKNLEEIMERVRVEGADLGVVVDPDVDRLAFIDERGNMFGEEYTLVSIADYILQNYSEGKYSRATVSNLSSSRALKDVSEKHGGEYFASAVGEVNVVTEMKKQNAVIGGEGNGGIIYPELHYGRDSLVGLALFLSALTERKIKVSAWKKELPEYYMVKDKMELTKEVDLQAIFGSLKEDYKDEKLTDIDGLKIDYSDSWVHLRASNTEPIVRLYAEAPSLAVAEERIGEIKEKIMTSIS